MPHYLTLEEFNREITPQALSSMLEVICLNVFAELSVSTVTITSISEFSDSSELKISLLLTGLVEENDITNISLNEAFEWLQPTLILIDNKLVASSGINADRFTF